MAQTRAQRNNNPGNLIFRGQRAAKGKDEAGFAIFPTPWEGFLALVNQIKLDQRRGLTLKQFIYKYAPPSENNTEEYLVWLTTISPNTSPDTPLIDLNPYALAGMIARREGWC